uniref:Uncharacterized protein n=1 Tax=Tetraselmis sp. GSL018 TaxID=582737 RepID=A0A061SIG3_9CHLO
MSTENKENLALENLNYSEFDALGSDMKSWKGFDWYLCLLDTNHVIFSIGKLRPEYSHIFLSTHVLNRVLLLTIRVFICRQFPLEEIREEITCPICLDLFQRPCTTACGKAVEVVLGFFWSNCFMPPRVLNIWPSSNRTLILPRVPASSTAAAFKGEVPKVSVLLTRCPLGGQFLAVEHCAGPILTWRGAGEQPALNSKGAPSNPLARRRAGGERSGSGTLGHVRAHYRCMECGFKGCFWLPGTAVKLNCRITIHIALTSPALAAFFAPLPCLFRGANYRNAPVPSHRIEFADLSPRPQASQGSSTTRLTSVQPLPAAAMPGGALAGSELDRVVELLEAHSLDDRPPRHIAHHIASFSQESCRLGEAAGPLQPARRSHSSQTQGRRTFCLAGQPSNTTRGRPNNWPQEDPGSGVIDLTASP